LWQQPDSIFVSVKTITDLAGNINNTASDSQIFKVDVVAPTITAFSAVSGVYKEGAASMAKLLTLRLPLL
jgi:hypothetical protein